MLDLAIWVYAGLALAIFGSLEVASVGVCLVLLSYNHTLALLTLIATTVVITLILLRAVSRLEEIGADV